MCTFQILLEESPSTSNINRKLQNGGPDATNHVTVNNKTFIHNLLHVTGEKTIQPIVKNNHVFLLLGEIYNWDTILPGDIYHGIDCYFKYGRNFTEYLDGEFLFIVYKVTDNIIEFYSDPWGTRQFCFDKNKNRFSSFTDYSFRSMPPALNAYNSLYTFENGTLQYDKKLHTWDLTQHKTDIETATKAFEAAVLKRWCPNCTLFLSSGVDSVSIALCLNKYKKPFNSIHVDYGLEDEETFNQVLELTKNYNNNYIITKPSHHPTDRLIKYGLHQEVIRNHTKRVFKSKVILMGTGGDELENYMSKGRSEFTIWPERLEDIFPWYSFNTTSQIQCNFHEKKGLRYGLETRNVFLDKNYVQNWLWLHQDIKNCEYKHIQKEYLRSFNIKLPEKEAAFNQNPLLHRNPVPYFSD